MESFDIIVVGGGLVGLASAYYAAAAGKRVLLLEAAPLFNNICSSKGESRFFRVMYADENRATLALAADPLWRALEAASKRRLREMNGVLFLGDESGPPTPEGDLRDCMKTMDKLGLKYTTYTGPQVQQQYPIWKQLPNPTLGIFQAEGGPIYAHRTLLALATLAWSHGVAMHQSEPVIGIEPAGSDDQPVTVRTTLGTYQAPRLILAPGAWANAVLKPLGIELLLEIWEMTLAYYAVSNPTLHIPLWFYFGQPQGQDEGTYYGFPPVEIPGEVKLSTDFTFKKYTSPDQCSRVPDPHILSYIEQFIATRLSGIDPRTVMSSADTCLFVMTTDQNFVLDFLPGYRNIVLFTGESGQAFKFGPLIGTILTDLALRGQTSYDISHFSILRPGIIKP